MDTKAVGMDDVLQWIAANAQINIAEDGAVILMASAHVPVGNEAYVLLTVECDGEPEYRFDVSLKAAEALCAMIRAAIAQNESWLAADD